jgi:hypothetical protein
MKTKISRKNNNFILGFLGIVLFFLVISVLYIFFFLSLKLQINDFQFMMPLVILTGFFIFLVGAILVALAISRRFIRRIR